MKGKVKFFNKEKGFGFIVAEGKEYFAHITNVFNNCPLEDGQNVFFDPVESKKGLKASNIDIDITVRK